MTVRPLTPYQRAFRQALEARNQEPPLVYIGTEPVESEESEDQAFFSLVDDAIETWTRVARDAYQRGRTRITDDDRRRALTARLIILRALQKLNATNGWDPDWYALLLPVREYPLNPIPQEISVFDRQPAVNPLEIPLYNSQRSAQALAGRSHLGFPGSAMYTGARGINYYMQ